MPADRPVFPTGDDACGREQTVVEPVQDVRRCGRCRAEHPVDPTLYFTSRDAWWLCTPCHEVLLGAARRRRWHAAADHHLARRTDVSVVTP